MTTTTLHAHRVAIQFHNDGLRFVTDTGVELDRACRDEAVRVEYARVQWDDDAREDRLIPVSRSDVHDRVRYVFADGSAIVVAGDAWDVEGATPFSWAGE